jgi:preprotein translocase subunit SecG
MELIVLSIHLLVCICLIGLVLLQRSEGGALGMGGGGGGGLVSGRGAADALARMTSVAGGFFLVTSLGLTMLSGAANSSEGRSVLDILPTQSAPATTPAPVPATPPATANGNHRSH